MASGTTIAIGVAAGLGALYLVNRRNAVPAGEPVKPPLTDPNAQPPPGEKTTQGEAGTHPADAPIAPTNPEAPSTPPEGASTPPTSAPVECPAGQTYVAGRCVSSGSGAPLYSGTLNTPLPVSYSPTSMPSGYSFVLPRELNQQIGTYSAGGGFGVGLVY